MGFGPGTSMPGSCLLEGPPAHPEPGALSGSPIPSHGRRAESGIATFRKEDREPRDAMRVSWEVRAISRASTWDQSSFRAEIGWPGGNPQWVPVHEHDTEERRWADASCSEPPGRWRSLLALVPVARSRGRATRRRRAGAQGSGRAAEEDLRGEAETHATVEPAGARLTSRPQGRRRLVRPTSRSPPRGAVGHPLPSFRAPDRAASRHRARAARNAAGHDRCGRRSRVRLLRLTCRAAGRHDQPRRRRDVLGRKTKPAECGARAISANEIGKDRRRHRSADPPRDPGKRLCSHDPKGKPAEGSDRPGRENGQWTNMDDKWRLAWNGGSMEWTATEACSKKEAMGKWNGMDGPNALYVPGVPIERDEMESHPHLRREAARDPPTRLTSTSRCHISAPAQPPAHRGCARRRDEPGDRLAM